MGQLVDFGMLMMPKEDPRWRESFNTLGQGLGQLGVGYAEQQRKKKVADIYKNAMDVWDYQHDADKFDKDAYVTEAEKAMRERELAASNLLPTDDVLRNKAELESIRRAKEIRSANKEAPTEIGEQTWNRGVEQDYDTRLLKLSDAQANEAFGKLFKSPEERAQYEAARKIFSKDMNDEQKYRRIAGLIAPWDKETSDTLLKLAEKRATEDTAAKAKGPVEKLTRLNQFVQTVSGQLADEKDNYRYLVENGASKEAKNESIAKQNAYRTELGRLQGVGKISTEGTEYSDIYAGDLTPKPSPAPDDEDKNKDKTAPDDEDKNKDKTAPYVPPVPKSYKLSDVNEALNQYSKDLETGAAGNQDAAQQALVRANIRNTAQKEQEKADAKAAATAKLAEAAKAQQALSSTAMKESGYDDLYATRTDYNAALVSANELRDKIVSSNKSEPDASINTLAKKIARMQGAAARLSGAEANVKEEQVVRDLLDHWGFKTGATAEEQISYLDAALGEIKDWSDSYNATLNSARKWTGIGEEGLKQIDNKHANSGIKPFYIGGSKSGRFSKFKK